MCSSFVLTEAELSGVLAREGVEAAELRRWREAALYALVDLEGSQDSRDRTARPSRRTLAEARTLLLLAREREGLELGGRGRLHPEPVRRRTLRLVQEATAAGARRQAVCRVLGLSSRTLQRWRSAPGRDRRGEPRGPPANRLSEQERREALSLVRSTHPRQLTPRQLVARLADQGRYLTSESTLYRLRRTLAPPAPSAARERSPSGVEQVALAPNQLWSWDITRLKSARRRGAFHLYVIVDVFSRRIMGWRVESEESMVCSSRLIRQACAEQRIRPGHLTLHSDNGGPMRGAVMRTTLRRLGVTSSFSRPRVSDDNPFSEALFRTLKARPTYLRAAFTSLARARDWVARFVRWYNREHLHSGIGFVTPEDRHSGRDQALLAQRREVYARARRSHPERWARHARRWNVAGPVRLRAMPSQACSPAC